jgi:hypothetical protein
VEGTSEVVSWREDWDYSGSILCSDYDRVSPSSLTPSMRPSLFSGT